jgi:hypothetical protein
LSDCRGWGAKLLRAGGRADWLDVVSYHEFDEGHHTPRCGVPLI